MNQEYHNLIVEKHNKIEIKKFDDTEDYIITNLELGNRVIVNQKTMDLLNLVDNKTPLIDIVTKYNQNSISTKIDIDTAYVLLYDKLARQGIILNENIIVKKKEIASYLTLSFTLINKKALNFFIALISPLISFKYFYKILFISLIIVTFTLVSNYTKLTQAIDHITLGQWLIYILIIGAILFLHEFGHASACKKLGAEPGNIGFGFYLLSPVMFADVSDIWKLSSKERNYVNFSGLYIEILLAMVLSLIFHFITADVSILIINSFILFNFVLNLNPFLRYDGYWILSDSIKTPNLRRVSIQKLNSFVSSIFNRNNFSFTKKDVFLIIYAFISMVAIFLFLGYILIRDPNSLFSFPVDAYNYTSQLVNNKILFQLSDLTKFILPLLFYLILGKFIVGYFGRFFKKQLM